MTQKFFWYVQNNFDVLWLKNDTAGLAFRPQLFFDETKSWTLTTKQTDELLGHEELHFIIGRLCLLKLYLTLQNTVFLKNEISAKTTAITTKIIAEFIQMNKDYDAETDHSKNKKEQMKWKDIVLAKFVECKSEL